MSVSQAARPRWTLSQERLQQAVAARLARLSAAERQQAERVLTRKQLRRLAAGRLRDANAAVSFAAFCGQPFDDFVDGPPRKDDRLETIETLGRYLAEHPQPSPRRSVIYAAWVQLREQLAR